MIHKTQNLSADGLAAVRGIYRHEEIATERRINTVALLISGFMLIFLLVLLQLTQSGYGFPNVISNLVGTSLYLGTGLLMSLNTRRHRALSMQLQQSSERLLQEEEELRRSEEKARFFENFDHLTTLPNIRHFRDDDFICRFMGDKFLVLLTDVQTNNHIPDLFRKTRTVFSTPVIVQERRSN